MLPGHSFRHADLSAHIQNLSEHPVKYGRFSDFYKGDMAVTSGSCKVLVKVIRAPTSGQYHALRTLKFKYEVSIIESLAHANVAEHLGVVFHLGQRPAIVMARYPHGDAPAFLEGRSINERHRVIKGVLNGLCYLHDRSPAIAHGDIRGANILINNSFEGVISDFSLSRLIEDGTEPQMAPESTAKTEGCVRWMARELFHDEPPIGPTHASDVWAFGCTFCELMLGNIPYSRFKRPASLICGIIQGTLPFSEEDAMRTGSDEMWAAVSRCWSPVPGDRPSIFELKNMLVFCMTENGER